jgi:DNA-directed RNA polymerase subunit M/transcription elongation factor TFIIS
MSTVFEVPCPECGRVMSVDADGVLHCSSCRLAYQLRMGHLFPVVEGAPSRRADVISPTTSSSS